MLLLILGFLTDFRVFTARWKVSSPLHSDRANQSCYKNELSGRAALLKDVSFENRAWAVQDGDGEAGWVSFGHAWPRPRALRGPPQKNPNSPCKSSIRSIPSVCGSLAPPGSFSLPPAQQSPGERLWRLQHPFPSVPCPWRGVPGAAGEKFRGRRAGDKSPRAPGHGEAHTGESPSKRGRQPSAARNKWE